MTKSASPIAFRTWRVIAMATRSPRKDVMIQATAAGPHPAPAQPGGNKEKL